MIIKTTSPINLFTLEDYFNFWPTGNSAGDRTGDSDFLIVGIDKLDLVEIGENN